MRRLRDRLVLQFLVAALPALVLAWGLASSYTRATLETEVGLRLEALAAAVAAPINTSGTAARVERLQPDSDLTRARIVEPLEAARLAGGLRRVRIVNAALELLVDTQGAEPGAVQFELASDRAEMAAVEEGANARATVLFESADGEIIKRAWAPIRVDGRLVAFVVVEGEAAAYAMLEELRVVMALIFALTILAILLAASLAARRVTSRVGRLAAAASAIARGDTATPVVAEGADEVGALGRDLDAMRTAIVAREEESRLMLAGIAHEIRNPLAGMELHLGFVEEDLPTDASTRVHVAALRRDLTHLSQVVSTFLAHASERVLRTAPEPVGRLVDAARDSLAPASAAASLTVEIDVAPDLAWSCDAEAMRGVLQNVLQNAVQASREGGRIHVDALRAGGLVHVRVRDEGEGMAPEVLASATRPFFTTRGRGSGLGLALARRVVERHGGELRLASVPGRGTTVTIALPAGDAAPSGGATDLRDPDDDMIG